MINVNPAFAPPQYSTLGELVCNNGGALFSNNASISTETICNVTAQWTIPSNADCYTSILVKLKLTFGVENMGSAIDLIEVLNQK